MWLLRTLGCNHLATKALIIHAKGKFLPLQRTQIVLMHQGIIQDTLLYRFFHFLGTCPKYSKLVVHTDNYEIFREMFVTKYGLLSESGENCFKIGVNLPQKMETLPFLDLLQFIIFLSKANLLNLANHYKNLLTTIDNVCCEKIPRLPVEEAVKLNYCLISLMGTEVKLFKSFNLLLDNFSSNIKENLESPVVVLILFCSGIARKHPKVKEVVKLSSNYVFGGKRLKELSKTEILLVSEVAFKTGLKIPNPLFMEYLVNIVSKDIPNFLKDPVLFVVAIKSMRQNKFHDRKFLRSVQRCLTAEKNVLSRYNFAGMSHLIALYADALYADQEFMNYLIDTTINSLYDKETYNPFNEKGKGRAKDMARLLWATSYLGFRIEPNVLENNIMPVILEKVESGVYRKQLSVLLDTVLSLWVMGHKPLGLLPHVFTKEMKKYLHEMNRVRYKARLQLLSTCVSIETPELINSMNLESFHLGDAYNPGEEKIFAQKPFLKSIVQDMRNVLSIPDSICITCENAMPFLNIPGILVSAIGSHERNSINIEVLDSTNCLHGTNIPNGLMLLKLRLLRELGQRIVLISHNDYESEKSQIMFQIQAEMMSSIHGS